MPGRMIIVILRFYYSLPPIDIRNQTRICSDAFIGPGVVVGDEVVVGRACAVVTQEVEAWTVVAGNPARGLGNGK